MNECPELDGPVLDAIDALSVTLHSAGPVVAAIELFDRQLAAMTRDDGACPEVALSRAHTARALLVELKRRIQAKF
ncbi:hypothetical protein VI08_09385 [Luteibacter yeojuensis]|uniref:Uncharacterized protein n=1 Tax=Luteibacter yeojuensis TaxID=345309 RepID=A0A0F3KXF2_9GAMM|nr:hypothetical protein VI08_09385 [Luteibacter yeojuensis]